MRTNTIREEWTSFVDNRDFPCVAAKAALTRQQQHVFIAGHMACPRNDKDILNFIYDFVDLYRKSDSLFHSVVVVFEQPDIQDEEIFSRFFWQRLQALSDLDAQEYDYDGRVSADPQSEKFSFSLKEEAFFIVGMHPASAREARRFAYPAIVFNPHAQFEQLRSAGQYEKMKNIIRKRDIALEGSINPMLEDFGASTEAFQYTGQVLDKNWKCPLRTNHGEAHYNQSA